MTHSAHMKSKRRMLIAALLLPGLAFSGSGQASDNAGPPADARPMTAYELYMLYGDKSWRWPNGAGLMETEGRRFTAFAGSGGERTLAKGRWIVTDAGRLCFKANWNTPSGIYPDRTCFAHLIHDDTIYQRKEPAGDWYVFKHAKPAIGDEFNALVGRDLVSPELARARPQTGSQQRSRTSQRRSKRK